MLTLGFLSYCICAFAYFCLSIMIIVRKRSSTVAPLLIGVASVQSGWALLMALLLTVIQLPPYSATVIEALRTFAWLAFLILIPVSFKLQSAAGPKVKQLRAVALTIALSLCVASVAVDLLALGNRWSFLCKVVAATYGIVIVEQIYRNTPIDSRWNIKFLAIAMVALFGFDLVMYSDALLFSRLNNQWWTARGFANALLMPLIAVATARAQRVKVDFTVSHKVAFHGATLIMAGGYLVVVSAIGYYLRLVGGSMGEVIQATVGFIAIVLLLVLLLSQNTRAALRVFVSKHFFAYRYDYREEWLRFTDGMSQANDKEFDSSTIALRALEALNRQIETRAGALWVLNSPTETSTQYIKVAQIGPMPAIPDTLATDDPVLEFLAQRDWVIDPNEYRDNPAAYGKLSLSPWAMDASLVLIAPLRLHGKLLGFAVLGGARTKVNLNWEVRDLIKTVGRQTASYLAQQQATQALIEVKQFDSFNKMSAFVVHDLKNLVAQLSLLLANATRHRDNPEFQADMLLTVENVLDRMQGLLLQLRVGSKPAEQPLTVDLTKIVKAAIDAKKGMAESFTIDLTQETLNVSGHADRLERVIGHIVQNAAEATRESDTKTAPVTIKTLRRDCLAQIVVTDYGIGMTPDFIRDKLFRPFNSTKGLGMGIGTYESREYIRELGGTIEVKSTSGRGTEFKIELPLIQVEQKQVAKHIQNETASIQARTMNNG